MGIKNISLPFLFLLIGILFGCKNPNLSWYKFENLDISGIISDNARGDSNLLYKADVLLEDIFLPEITSITGRAKLVKHTSDYFAIGYEIEIEVDSLRPKNIPQKYKQELVVGGVQVFPLQEVVYDIEFEFALLDKDGFKIKSIKSLVETIRSGEKNTYKRKTNYDIQESEALLVEDIKLYTIIEKCKTCEVDFDELKDLEN